MQTEQFNETWSIVNFDWTSDMETGFLQVYNRPGQLFCRHFYFAVYTQDQFLSEHIYLTSFLTTVYQLVQGPSWVNETAVVYLIYSGNRWFGTWVEYEKDVLESKEFRAANEWGFRNYHCESICNNEYSIMKHSQDATFHRLTSFHRGNTKRSGTECIDSVSSIGMYPLYLHIQPFDLTVMLIHFSKRHGHD